MKFAPCLTVCLVLVPAAVTAQPMIARNRLPAASSPQLKAIVERLYDMDPAVRYDAAKSCGQLKGADATAVGPFLASMLSDEGEIWGEAGTVGIKIIYAGEPPKGGRPLRIGRTAGHGAIEGLALLGRPAVEPIIAEIRRADHRAVALRPDPRRLSEMAEGTQKLATTSLMNEACSALGGITDEEAVEPLTEAMKDPNELIRIAALAAFARGRIRGLDVGSSPVTPELPKGMRSLQSDLAVEAIIDCLGDGSEAVRATAAGALASGSDSRMVRPLLGLLKDDSSTVRAAAAETLGHFSKMPEVAAALGVLFKDRDAVVRTAAATALGSGAALPGSGTSSEGVLDVALTSLIESLKDRNTETVVNAINSLRNMKAPLAADALLEATGHRSPQVRAAAFGALSVLEDSRTVAPALRSLRDPNAGVRSMAAQALIPLKDRSALDALCSVVKSDQDVMVRVFAARALGAIGDPKAVPALQKMHSDGQRLRHDDLQISASNAINAINGGSSPFRRLGRE